MQGQISKTKEPPKPLIKTQVQEMLAVITAFANLVEKETAALKKADFKTVDALQADKKLLAKQYHMKVMALAEMKDELMKLELPLREKLVKERTRFTILLNDNMRALELAQNSTRRLIDRILEAARKYVMEERKTNYSNAGKTTTYKSASNRLSVDQSL